jgi:hypothetical protein
VHWDERATHFGIFEDAAGRRLHTDGVILPAYADPRAIPGVEDPGAEPAEPVEQRLVYERGTRRLARAEIALLARSGERLELELEPLLRFQMKGLGYLHPQWGHGVWKGELAVGGESWKCDELDALALENVHVQQLVRVRAGRHRGVGTLEHLALGPHAPSGFSGLLDGAG